MVELHQIGQDRVQVVPRRHLAEIIAPRAREILEMVRLEMRLADTTASFPAASSSPAGGCRLLGFTEAAQSLLDLPVRIGAPSQTIGMRDQVSGPAYATAVGCCAGEPNFGTTATATRPLARALRRCTSGPFVGSRILLRGRSRYEHR